MACARKLRGAMAHVAEGDWERTLFPGLMLKGRSIGLIGNGADRRLDGEVRERILA